MCVDNEFFFGWYELIWWKTYRWDSWKWFKISFFSGVVNRENLWLKFGIKMNLIGRKDIEWYRKRSLKFKTNNFEWLYKRINSLWTPSFWENLRVFITIFQKKDPSNIPLYPNSFETKNFKKQFMNMEWSLQKLLSRKSDKIFRNENATATLNIKTLCHTKFQGFTIKFSYYRNNVSKI